ncbi:putative apyrase 7 [Forsythia ovata]|uniref:Apyrase 7 n=1 Tax=Forsythia ovata TaxID=205694 RepID=A0ABD1P6N1_9LAMI
MESESPSKSKLQIIGLIHNPRMLKIIITTNLVVISSIIIIGGYFIFRQLSIVRFSSSFFTVVFDCGSTGTRVNVYKWMVKSPNEHNGELPVLLHSFPENLTKNNGCQYHCMQTEPGLHNFVGNASGVRTSLEPLINYAEQWVPLERRGITPIYVMATAGMRSLAVEDANRVMEDAENVVKEHGFLYGKKWIKVLSGKEEAYYGWVALNYKMGVFGNSSRSSTLGLLDLGGSSLQVVAEVEDSVENEHVFRSKIGFVEHDIIAFSLPAFGLNEAFDQTIVMLSHTQELRESIRGRFEVRHPCLGAGFLQNYTCHGCFGLESLDSRESGNLSIWVQENELKTLLLVGKPNWEQCKVLARAAAINSSNSEWLHQAYHSNCIGLFSYRGKESFNLTKSSRSVRRYHALSGFFAISNALNLNERANLTKMWESGQQLCSRSWADQTSINGQYCFRVPYLASLIENALCLSGMEIIFGPGDISWTLGAALVEGEFLWLNNKKSENGFLTLKNEEMISSPILVFAALLILLFIVYYSKIKLPMPGTGRKVAAANVSLPSYLCPKRQPN